MLKGCDRVELVVDGEAPRLLWLRRTSGYPYGDVAARSPDEQTSSPSARDGGQGSPVVWSQVADDVLRSPEYAELLAARGDDVLARVTIGVDGGDHAQWEQTLGAPRVVVVRRSQTRARDCVAATLPLRILIDDRQPLFEPILDPFVEQLAGTPVVRLEWMSSGGTSEPHILHRILPADPIAASNALMELQGAAVLPTLLVLHDPGGAAPFLSPGLRFLAERAPAVLYVPRGDGFAPPFFPTFYRKLLHDWPLDRAVLEASTPFAPHRRPVLFLREGAETALLLTGSVRDRLDAINRRPASRLQRREGAVTAGPGKGRPATRLERVVHDVIERVTADAAQRYDEFVATVDFTQETHGAQQSARVEEDLRALGGVVDAARTLAAHRDDELLARTTNVWLTDAGADVSPKERLVADRRYGLNVQIGAARAGAAAASDFPEEALHAYFARTGSLTLDVVLYAPDDVEIEARRGAITLKRLGESSVFSTFLIPRKLGALRARVCVFFRSTLLQTVAFSVTVGDAAAPGSDEPVQQRVVDYRITTDFNLLEELPSPDLTLVLNQTGGSHWLCAYAEGAESAPLAGKIVALDHLGFTTIQAKLVARLRALGETDYGLARATTAYPVPRVDDAAWKVAEEDFVDLARTGRVTYVSLFMSARRELEPLTRRATTLSVARCKEQTPSLPWGALYDYDLDTGTRSTLCQVFLAQLRNESDLLDEPAKCRAQATCPLRVPGAEKSTVCPFGFWGARMTIDQPLEHEPEREAVLHRREVAPPPRPSMTVHAPRVRSDPLRVCAGVLASLSEAPAHAAKLNTFLQLDWRADRDAILAGLTEQKWDAFYFFCHGRHDELEFVLEVGPTENGDTISNAGFPSSPSPDAGPGLVFMNACDSVANNASTLNEFIVSFRDLGATGIIGTEIEVHERLACYAASEVFASLSAGDTLGKAFLTLRRGLLRSLNPLGFAYTFYASAWYHFGEDGRCVHCGS